MLSHIRVSARQSGRAEQRAGPCPETEKLSPLMRRWKPGPAWPALGSWKVLLQDGPWLLLMVDAHCQGEKAARLHAGHGGGPNGQAQH